MKKTTIIILFIVCLLAEIILVHNFVSAETINLADESQLAAEIKEANAVSTAKIAGKIAQLMVGVSGAFLLLMFVYGGFLMLSAAGSEEQIKKGNDAIKKAAVGFFIIILSYLTIALLIEALTRVPPPTHTPSPQPTPPVNPTPQPQPPDPTGCTSGYTEDANGCCGNFSTYPGSNPSIACSSSATYCCDCGHTNESVSFSCTEDTMRNIRGENCVSTDVVPAVADFKCTFDDGNQYTVIEGHCGIARWWCSKLIGTAVAKQCSDGIDNDGDGRIDFGTDNATRDFGCDSADDNNETKSCEASEYYDAIGWNVKAHGWACHPCTGIANYATIVGPNNDCADNALILYKAAYPNLKIPPLQAALKSPCIGMGGCPPGHGKVCYGIQKLKPARPNLSGEITCHGFYYSSDRSDKKY